MKTIYTSREEEEMHEPIDGHIDTKTYSYIYLYIYLYKDIFLHIPVHRPVRTLIQTQKSCQFPFPIIPCILIAMVPNYAGCLQKLMCRNKTIQTKYRPI